MKLHLPKILLAALLSMQAYTPAIGEDSVTVTGSGWYESSNLVLSGDITMSGGGEYDDVTIFWITQSEQALLQGSGSISSDGNSQWYMAIVSEGTTAKAFTIGENVALKNAVIDFGGNVESTLKVNGILEDCEISEMHGVVDLTDATVQGKTMYDISGGSKLIVRNLEVKENVGLETYSNEYSLDSYPQLEGNLVLSGKLPTFTAEQRYDYSHDGWSSHMHPYGFVQFWVSGEEDYFTPLEVTGSITVSSETVVIFANEGDYRLDESVNTMYWVSDYRLPTNEDVLFTCSGVNETSLSLLRPYAYREDSWMQYENEESVSGGYEYIKPVTDREFYAQAGTDGKVYIYLGEKQEDGGEDDIVTPPVEPDYVVLNSQEGTNISIRDKNITLSGSWSPQRDENGLSGYLLWEGTDEGASYTLTGSGTIGNETYQTAFSIEGAGEYVVGEDITIVNAEIELEHNDAGDSPTVIFNGTLKDCKWKEIEGRLDLRNATLSGFQAIALEQRSVLVRDVLEIKEKRSSITVYNNAYSGVATNPRIVGSLELDGGGSYFSDSEQLWTVQETPYTDVNSLVRSLYAYNSCICFEKDSPTQKYLTLEITGSLTVKSETAVMFGVWDEAYSAPDKEDCLFICSSVNEGGLQLLLPYVQRADYEYAEESVTYTGHTKPLDDREFYAQAGTDGKVYIYLGEKQEEGGEDDIVTPPIPPAVEQESVVLNSWPSGDKCSKNVELRGDCALSPDYCFRWEGTGAATNYVMTGNGAVSVPDGAGWYLQISAATENALKFSINDITLENALIDFHANASSELQVNALLQNCNVHVWDGKVDVSNATLSGKTFIQISRGATLAANSLEIKQNIALRNYDGYPETASAGYATVEGNLVLNGTLPAFSTEMQSDYDGGGWIPQLLACGYVQFWTGDEKLSPLNVTGSITINSGTAVVFSNEGEYRLPDSADAVFICSSVDETSLEQLKPYTHRQDFSANVAYTKLVDDREFYAKSIGNKVYVYLGEAGDGNTPGIPAVPDMTVKPGETVVLGSEGGMLPSIQNPVQMQGGVADATGLSDSLLNNKVIGGTSGVLQTGANQTMSLTGGGKVRYSIVGSPGNVHGADLVISSTSNLTLEGEKYTAETTKVNRGNVTISGKSILGTGAATDILDLTAKGVSATNFGTVAAGVELGAESTFLNQNKVLGDVKVGADATLLNNAVIEGQVVAARGGAVYGSGVFAETMLATGSRLHVGNSPGYQKHNSLTIDRGATLSFSVDGPVAATATSHGSGTYSVLEAGALTINPGTGTVTVNVDVTMGIVAAGSEPLSLTLLDAGTTNATESDFTLELSDESNLLEEGASLSFDATEGTLVLKGAVNKAALAALMDSNSANVANTMWASANAVQEMARTAEHQLLVGMPGQTTFWGAAMGSFMDVSGKQGFTSNMGGYAVGLQHAFTKSFRAGVAFGQSFGDFKSDDDQLKADQMALMPTLTAQYVTPLNKTSSLTVSGHIAYGVVENEADTYQTGTKGKAEWDDQVLNIGIRAAWNSELTDNTTVSLFTGLSYQNVEQDSFTEKFTGGERDYRSGSLSSLSIPVGVTLRGIYQMDGTNILAPELTLAYIGDVARDNPEVKTNVYGFNREGKGTNIGRSAFMLNAGANWMFDSTWSLGAFYTLEARSNQVNQSVNAALRCCF